MLKMIIAIDIVDVFNLPEIPKSIMEIGLVLKFHCFGNNFVHHSYTAVIMNGELTPASLSEKVVR